MKLTVAQLKVMGGLLDEALPLDIAARSAWLEGLPPEYRALVPSLRAALLWEAPAEGTVESLDILPSIDIAGGAAASSAPQAGARIGPYELVRRLGVGGMAEVWLARRADGAFRREVALKLPMLGGVRGDLQGRFARERDILASLEHPLIARFYDAGVDPGGMPYLCMEYVQGQPVTDWCDAGRLSIDARVSLFLQVLEAVQYAHEKQVVHRDLKPSNILVTGSGQVRLLDFGVAKLLETAESDRTPLTRLYGRALTPDYAAPELLRGESIDARSDVYSLGVLFYELLTGARPYRLQNAASMGLLDVAIATIEVPKPSAAVTDAAATARASSSQRMARQLRGPMDAIVFKALARSPSGRYASASEFAAALRRHLNDKRDSAPLRILGAMRTTAARRGIAAATAAVLVITLAIFFRGHWPRAGGSHAATAPASTATATAAATAAAPAVVDAVALAPTSLAVLPFVNESESPAEAYYPDALAYRLTLLLARVRKLQVTFSSAARHFRDSTLPVTVIAQQLAVQWVLVGQVHKEGSQIHVAVQLIRAADGRSRWSKTYDRDIREGFPLEEGIAMGVVEALDAGVLGGALPRRAVPTVPAAYDLLLRALGIWMGPDPVNLELPVQYMRRAVALDPDYADAWAALGWAYRDRRIPPGDPDIAKARSAGAQALRLDPRNETANILMQDIHLTYDWDWSAAEKDLGSILESDPAAEVQTELGFLELENGRTARALALLRHAMLRDPLEQMRYNNLGILFYGAGRFEEAEALFRKSLMVDSTQGWRHHHLGLVLLAQGKHDAALAEIARETSPIMRLRGLVVVRYARGETAQSDAALAELIREYRRSENDRGDSSFVGPYAIASVYAYRGEADAAFEWLERARRLKALGMFYLDVRHDPLLARLHADARFKKLLRELGLAEVDAGN